MVAISVRSNVRTWERKMTAIQRRQVPFATAKALTDTAGDVKKNFPRTMARRLDRPTPFTMRGMFVARATKARLIASVGFKPIQSGYLDKPERGGTRRPKGRAIVLPAAQKVNRYGNLPKGAVRRLLARADTFSGEVRGVAGIWQRRKGGLTLLVAYARQASYRPQLGFHASARKTILARFPINWRRAFALAVRTAR